MRSQCRRASISAVATAKAAEAGSGRCVLRPFDTKERAEAFRMRYGLVGVRPVYEPRAAATIRGDDT
jgi:hypothetical protein